MALQQLYEDSATGQSEPTAYHKIMNVTLIKDSRVNIVLGIFKEQGKEQPLRIREYTVVKDNDDLGDPEADPPVDPNTPFEDNFSIGKMDAVDANIIKNAYNYLKNLPEFSASTDVLE